jgi:hypothetical protein
MPEQEEDALTPSPCSVFMSAQCVIGMHTVHAGFVLAQAQTSFPADTKPGTTSQVCGPLTQSRAISLTLQYCATENHCALVVRPSSYNNSCMFRADWCSYYCIFSQLIHRNIYSLYMLYML